MLIYSSSCSTYGNVKGKVSELRKPNPQSYYAITKYKSENLINCYDKFKGNDSFKVSRNGVILSVVRKLD